jgi:hypothetical protein
MTSLQQAERLAWFAERAREHANHAPRVDRYRKDMDANNTDPSNCSIIGSFILPEHYKPEMESMGAFQLISFFPKAFGFGGIVLEAVKDHISALQRAEKAYNTGVHPDEIDNWANMVIAYRDYVKACQYFYGDYFDHEDEVDSAREIARWDEENHDPLPPDSQE